MPGYNSPLFLLLTFPVSFLSAETQTVIGHMREEWIGTDERNESSICHTMEKEFTLYQSSSQKVHLL